MKTIWKFLLEFQGEQVVAMPANAKLLHAGEQNGSLVLWAEVNSDAPKVNRLIAIHGTGHPMDGSMPSHVGTVIMPSGLVWHVYDHGDPMP